MKWSDFLVEIKKSIWAVFGLGLIGVIGYLDAASFHLFSISIFYLVPIGMTTWYAGREVGTVLSSISAVVWLLTEFQAQGALYHPTIYFWNTSIRLGFFFVVTFLVAALKNALEKTEKLARTDYLTGASNTQFFYWLVERELARSERYARPITLCYFDLDNFKPMNDQFGHSTGDQVLKEIVDSLRLQLRTTDFVGRLGGDEFAALLPETNEEHAKLIVTRLQRLLLEKMQERGWPVTFSFGVVTCYCPTISVNELLKKADDLMYSVKRGQKNGIAYEVCGKPTG